MKTPPGNTATCASPEGKVTTEPHGDADRQGRLESLGREPRTLGEAGTGREECPAAGHGGGRPLRASPAHGYGPLAAAPVGETQGATLP